MKIKIGPHINWVGPYQIADLLQKFGVSEKKCLSIGEKLEKTFVNDICNYIHKRIIKIKIDPYDSWNADVTLSLIIAPLLKQLNLTKHGSPYTEDEDVPEGLGLRSYECAPKKEEFDVDDNHHERWHWILSEMIWAHEQMIVFDYKYSSVEESVKYEKRIDNGLRLFGVYYRNLWD